MSSSLVGGVDLSALLNEVGILAGRLRGAGQPQVLAVPQGVAVVAYRGYQGAEYGQEVAGPPVRVLLAGRRDLVETTVQHLGPYHPDTLTARHNLA
jgi:hypothetical protein